MGELSAETLQLRGIRGYIVDGGSRDMDFILKIDFPVWSKFYTPRDVVKFLGNQQNLRNKLILVQLQ